MTQWLRSDSFCTQLQWQELTKHIILYCSLWISTSEKSHLYPLQDIMTSHSHHKLTTVTEQMRIVIFVKHNASSIGPVSFSQLNTGLNGVNYGTLVTSSRPCVRNSSPCICLELSLTSMKLGKKFLSLTSLAPFNIELHDRCLEPPHQWLDRRQDQHWGAAQSPQVPLCPVALAACPLNQSEHKQKWVLVQQLGGGFSNPPAAATTAVVLVTWSLGSCYRIKESITIGMDGCYTNENQSL